MTIDLAHIEHLAENHEGIDVEFKETTGQLDRGMETLCGMLNGTGGIVIFGVKNSGKIVGQEIGDKTSAQLTYGSHLLDSHTSEPPNETIARVMYYSGVIEHWGRGLSMIFEECKRARLPQPIVTDERGVVKVIFMRPNLSGHKNGTINGTINGMINDTINENERLIYNRIVSLPGISAVTLADEFGKSVRTIMRVLKHLVDLNIIEYRGSKKTGGYFSL